MNASTPQTAPAPAEVWSTGDYADVCETMIPGLGARLIELAEVRPGQRVLDLAAGTGNAAIPAAAIGAEVTALDITSRLLAVAVERAADVGLTITGVEGDAQALPFEDADFDCVVSCVGVQFCVDQDAAAREAARVCRPGGRIALIAWTPEGFIGQVLAAVGRAVGAVAPSPLAWGRESGVRELFAGQVSEIAFDREQVTMPAPSAQAWVDYMAQAYGPMVLARLALERRDAWPSVREQLIEIAAAHDRGDRRRFVGSAEYLTVIMRR